MRIISIKDTKKNLCDTCPLCFATCRQTILEFGNGTGDDNVISCSSYCGKITDSMQVGGVAPKLFDDVYMSAFLKDIHTGTHKLS